MTNVTETTIEEIDAFAHQAFMDGIITGQPIAKTVNHIVDTAYMFGVDEAERRGHVTLSCTYNDMDAVRRDAIASIVEGLFGGKGLRAVIRGSVRAAAAFGFKQAEARMDAKEAAERNAHIEAVLAEAVDGKGPGGQLTLEATDKLFHALNRLVVETAVVYARKAMVDEKLVPDASSEDWKMFTRKYADLAMMA